MDVPQVVLVITQHTPNPAAQLPSAVPPFEEHSELVKQVPKVEVELAPVHCWLGNWTMENREKASTDKDRKWRGSVYIHVVLTSIPLCPSILLCHCEL